MVGAPVVSGHCSDDSFKAREPMALEHSIKSENKLDSLTPRESQEDALHSWLSSSSLRDMQRLNNSGDLTSGQFPNTRIYEKGESFCAAPVKDPPETHEQRLDNKIKSAFGADVFDKLKDWDWLVDNQDKLKEGFKKANSRDAWDMARRMNELSVVDGKALIYMKKVDSATSGSLIPKRYDIFLRRGRLRSDDEIGHLHH
jgi:hypothetical protein